MVRSSPLSAFGRLVYWSQPRGSLTLIVYAERKVLTSSLQADDLLCPAQNIPLAKFVPSAND